MQQLTLNTFGRFYNKYQMVMKYVLCSIYNAYIHHAGGLVESKMHNCPMFVNLIVVLLLWDAFACATNQPYLVMALPSLLSITAFMLLHAKSC